MSGQTPVAEISEDNEELLALMTGPAEGAVSSKDRPRLRDVVHKGDEEFPAPIVQKVYSDAGVVPIYDLRTGDRSFTGRNMLPAQLRKVNGDGQKMFAAHRPVVNGKALTPTPGTHKCHLHPEDPARAQYDAWGFATCRKANLLSPFHVERHMQNRHKVEWTTIKTEQERAEKAQERQAQREHEQALVAALAGRTPVDAEPSKAGRRAG